MSNVEESTTSFWSKLHCTKCPEDGNVGRISPGMLANQCDEETCKCTTRSLNLRLIGDAEKGTVCPNYPHCKGRLVRKYSAGDLYKQVSYFCLVLDTVRCIEKVEISTRMTLEKKLAKIRPVVDLAASTIQCIRDQNAYGWVQLQDLAVTI